MKKVVIIYNRKDDSYKEQLIAHLSGLVHRKIIETWHDRDILAGDVRSGVIDENVNQASVILLLISPDFISSEYCNAEEMKLAVELHRAGRARVIPILARPCDTEGALFDGLNKVPEGKWISQCEDKDGAFLEVVEEIKRAVREVEHVEIPAPKLDYASRREFSQWLNDTEVVFKNRAADVLFLDDIYVYPDLRSMDTDDDSFVETPASSLFKKKGYTVVLGEEQSGKTAFAKSLYKDSLKYRKKPIFIDADGINESNVFDLCSEALRKQYEDICDLSEISYEERVLIVDNMSSIALNKRHQNLLLDGIQSEFGTCIVLASDSFQYVMPDIDGLAGFSVKEILPFGNYKREKLIEKWVSVGRDKEIDEADLFYSVDDLKSKIDSLVRRSVVPPKPIYLLSLMQIFEAYTTQQIDLTSFGHCYQHLVYQALEKADITTKDIDKYMNVMTEFAWAQFENSGELNDDKLKNFFRQYSEIYLAVNEEDVVSRLLRCSILTKNEKGFKFKYPYIYYFFAAKYISEQYNKSRNVKSRFIYLLENLHKEDCANIIVFITHHTKDAWILDEIQICMMELFQEQDAATLERSSLSFMESFLEDIPELILEQRRIEDEREKKAQELDRLEQDTVKFENEIDNLEPSDTLARVNKAFKGIEIIGQIVRNRSASLPKSTLVDIVEEGFHTGLRFLSYFLSISDSSKDEVIKIIEHVLKENPRVSDKDLEKEAKHTYMLLTYGVIFGVLRKVSNSMGGIEVEEICRIVEEKNGTPAIKLINQSMHLHFHKRLDFKRITSLQKEFRSNPTCKRILKENIIQHTYMFPVKFRDKQRLSETLGISMQTQRRMENAKGGKM
ncbi:toll-Interleukin receptor [Halomonas litopenaei]|uniref:Toll-Interleukin receptor n=1 Tax=Halomonas litopenaei TaxID=2109328 RepID=A0ABX5IVB7_9GAMM|nr:MULTISPECIES: toll/interleukin-1 receptor domain-containing protein [Halomonas]PTL92416.1 toll-Interleukin receptor [Halomonas sp. SYSU XM8]PTL94518.1 toll-Interleukin receptor [Halomonas litopenaei]